MQPFALHFAAHLSSSAARFDDCNLPQCYRPSHGGFDVIPTGLGSHISPYSTLQYRTVPSSTVQYRTVPYSTRSILPIGSSEAHLARCKSEAHPALLCLLCLLSYHIPKHSLPASSSSESAPSSLPAADECMPARAALAALHDVSNHLTASADADSAARTAALRGEEWRACDFANLYERLCERLVDDEAVLLLYCPPLRPAAR